MKKEYLEPDIEVLKFQAEDIIMTSLETEPDTSDDDSGDMDL